MKKFYVASSFRNIVKVRYVAQALEALGYVNTYDWTRERVGGDAVKPPSVICAPSGSEREIQ